VLASDHAYVVILAQLCQQLRRTVVSTPSLWSTLSLSSMKPIEKAKLWKSRNGGILRALYLRDDNENGDICKALKVFRDMPMINKLRSLSVDNIPWENFLSALPDIASSIISEVHFLELRRTSTIGYLWFRNSDRDIVNLNVRHLIAHASYFDWDQVGERATNLIHLSYEGLRLRPWIPEDLLLLDRNRNLESISLTITGCLPPSFPRASPSFSPPIELPRLYSLTLGGTGLYPEYLLPHVVMPNLRHLVLKDLFSELGATIQNLIDIGAVDGLISLVVTCKGPQRQRIDSGVLVDVLRHAKQLRHLTLSRLSQARTVIESMMEESLCPHLEEIDLSESSDVTHELLAALVQARNLSPNPNYIAPMHTLKIKNYHPAVVY
jgi:F-box/TPR repeat protein Pof3